MVKIDFKMLQKDLYAPQNQPSLINVPLMNFLMVDGSGNPNDSEGEYPKAVELLYALSYSIKMGNKLGTIGTEENVFPDYVVPPLEGLWWLNDMSDYDFTQKDKYCWTSMIRQPDFVTMDMFLQAQSIVFRKKPGIDVSKARFETFEEGLCVQCMHIGPYDTEPSTVEKIKQYILNNKLTNDFETQLSNGQFRRHHEIYLADPRKVNPLTMKTILRHPVKQL